MSRTDAIAGNHIYSLPAPCLLLPFTSLPLPCPCSSHLSIEHLNDAPLYPVMLEQWSQPDGHEDVGLSRPHLLAARLGRVPLIQTHGHGRAGLRDI